MDADSRTVRIRGVSEINCEMSNSTGEEDNEVTSGTINENNNNSRRKLPEWMMRPVACNGNADPSVATNGDGEDADGNLTTPDISDNEGEAVDENEASSSSNSNTARPAKRKTTESPSVSSSASPTVKEEQVDEAEGAKRCRLEEVDATNEVTTGSGEAAVETTDNVASCSSGQSSSVENSVKIEPQVKEEPADNDEATAPQPSAAQCLKPVAKVEPMVAEATSSTSRESCRFGIRCYRLNPIHRMEEAHPGDSDYKRPSYPSPPAGTPDCPFGKACYRRNPLHFQQFNHPADN